MKMTNLIWAIWSLSIGMDNQVPHYETIILIHSEMFQNLVDNCE